MVRPQVAVEQATSYSIAWGLGWRLAHTVARNQSFGLEPDRPECVDAIRTRRAWSRAGNASATRRAIAGAFA